jgi:small subunit ribosomal protein S3
MGQKINPIGFRMGISRDWTAKWYAGTKSYTQNLLSDIALRDYLKIRLKNAALSTVVIERPAQSINITVHTARPGIVIGKKGEDIEKLRQELTKLAGRPVQLAVEEVRQPELDAQLVAENIAQQLEKRIMFRRAMKRAVTNAMRLRALGIKIMVAGRLNGAEIARTEWYREGRVPLHTLRADIDYGFSEAHTTYGKIGVKVWIFKGEVFDKDAPKMEDAEAQKKGATAG